MSVAHCLRMLSHSTTTTLEQARVLGANLVEDFKKMLDTSPDMKFYLKYYQDPSHLGLFKNYIEMKKVGYELCFWDHNMDRPKKPYIAAVYFTSCTFRYYVANENTQALELVFEEPYEEALKFRDSMPPQQQLIPIPDDNAEE